MQSKEATEPLQAPWHMALRHLHLGHPQMQPHQTSTMEANRTHEPWAP